MRNRRVVAPTSATTTSPTWRPNDARATGAVNATLPSSGSASSTPTMVNRSVRPARPSASATSRTVTVAPTRTSVVPGAGVCTTCAEASRASSSSISSAKAARRRTASWASPAPCSALRSARIASSSRRSAANPAGVTRFGTSSASGARCVTTTLSRSASSLTNARLMALAYSDGSGERVGEEVCRPRGRSAAVARQVPHQVVQVLLHGGTLLLQPLAFLGQRHQLVFLVVELAHVAAVVVGVPFELRHDLTGAVLRLVHGCAAPVHG